MKVEKHDGGRYTHILLHSFASEAASII